MDLDSLAVQVEGLDLEENKLGTGAYGVVYRVTVNGRECIAKKLHTILLGAGENPYVMKEGIVERFRNECRILSKLDHPNVIHFVGIHYGRDRNDMSLIMERLDFDLATFVECYPLTPLSDRLQILYDVSKGLHYMHTLLLIHRDLTAFNILLTEDLTAKIADLGVSRYLDPSMVSVTRLKTNPAYFVYMPPESLTKNPQYSTKLDIFSFGNLILHTINNKLPSVCNLPVSKMHKLNPEGKVELMRREDSLHENMNDKHCLYPLVVHCLHDRPEGRPLAEEVVAILRKLCAKYPQQVCQ